MNGGSYGRAENDGFLSPALPVPIIRNHGKWKLEGNDMLHYFEEKDGSLLFRENGERTAFG